MVCVRTLNVFSTGPLAQLFPLAQLLSAHAIGAVDQGFDSPLVESSQCRQRLATAAIFLWSCVVQALSRGDGSRHSEHASTECHEYSEDLKFLLVF